MSRDHVRSTLAAAAGGAPAPARSTPTPPARRAPPAAGVTAVLVAFAALSLGSTLAKSSGSPGAVVAFWRLLIGTVVWHALVAVLGGRGGARRTVTPAAWRAATLPGIAFGVNLACFFSGATRTPIAHAEFISALTPVVMVPLAARRLRERVDPLTAGCGFAAICGVALILGRSGTSGTSLAGDALVVAAVAAWIAYLLVSRQARDRIGTVPFMAVMSTAACATTLPIALATGGGASGIVGLSTRGWVVVVALALSAGVVAHGLIAWSQQRVGLGVISMLQLGQPGLGVGWAAVLLGESVAGVQLVGMAVVLVSVGTLARRAARPTPRP